MRHLVEHPNRRRGRVPSLRGDHEAAPTQIELWINLTTAKALGIDMPFQLQQLADRVIE
jgi:hypothetical protein